MAQSNKPTLSINHLGMKLDTEQNGLLISNMIDAVKEIHCLIMSGNTLGVDASKVIANSLSRQPTLKEAIFADMFTGRLKTEIPEVLKNLSDAMIKADVKLEELDLSDNAIGPMAMPGIEEFISSKPCFSLKKLYFNNCGLGYAGITLANRLMQCKDNAANAGHEFALKTFIAGRNRQEDNGANAWAKCFAKLGTLERIELPQNGIKKDGIISLAQGIQNLENLRFFNINDNTCTVDGARALANSFQHMENLERVDIGDCLCRSATIDIVQTLSDNCDNLKYLDLTGNEITFDLAEDICEILIQNEVSQLSHVKMGLNCYGDQFNDLVEKYEEFGFFDFGDEDDDEGSLPDSEGNSEGSFEEVN